MSSAPAQAAAAPAAAAAAPPLRARRRPPRRWAATPSAPGDTLSGLAAGARVSVSAIAAMNGLDPSGILVAGTVIKLPTGAPAPARAAQPAPAATVVPQAAPAPTATRVGAADVQTVAAAARRLPLAGDRDRLAGERLQQQHGLQRQRARRHAGHAGHVGLRAAEPRPAPAEPELRARQRDRRRALPQEPAQPDRRRRVLGDRGLLPGPRRAALARRVRRHASSTSPTCRRCAVASAARPRTRPAIRSATGLSRRGPFC